jgi:hypothetical protein
MITLQNIEISWTKEARGGKLAAVRNGVPHAFEISFERKNQRLENCISVHYESARIEDTATDKLISAIYNLIFAVEDNTLQIKMPKYNGYDKKIATLQNGQSIQFIRFSKSMDYDHNTTYHKKIANLVFSHENIPLDYFLTHSFDYQFDEKSHIWRDKM